MIKSKNLFILDTSLSDTFPSSSQISSSRYLTPLLISRNPNKLTYNNLRPPFNSQIQTKTFWWSHGLRNFIWRIYNSWLSRPKTVFLFFLKQFSRRSSWKILKSWGNISKK